LNPPSFIQAKRPEHPYPWASLKSQHRKQPKEPVSLAAVMNWMRDPPSFAVWLLAKSRLMPRLTRQEIISGHMYFIALTRVGSLVEQDTV
jgi:hypothetical protein